MFYYEIPVMRILEMNFNNQILTVFTATIFPLGMRYIWPTILTLFTFGENNLD